MPKTSYHLSSWLYLNSQSSVLSGVGNAAVLKKILWEWNRISLQAEAIPGTQSTVTQHLSLTNQTHKTRQ